MVSTLRHDQQAASHFVADYSEFVRQSDVADIEVLEGRDKAYQRMQHFQPTKSVWAILPPPYVAPSHEPHESPDIPFLERGVDGRALMAESVLNITAIRRHFRYLLGFGSQFRTMPTVPPKLVIFDGESVVLGIDPDDPSVGVVVHHSRAVVRMAEELFLSYWDRAVDPFAANRLERQGGINDQERAFLGLLVQGSTDEQVGRKLGVSLRTVRRVAAKLSEQVGASGRFELGVRAARRGWVD